ncbi:MAG TPA: hypothetical protein VKP30_31310 [Polyangiaceae bacterium]|nr:hypothetical protein [Polyangiaceae bacterium]
MTRRTIRTGLALSAIIAAGLSVACGSDDSSSPTTASYADLVSAIQSPTGSVSAATAPKVAEEFAKVNSSGLNGTRRIQESQDVSAQICTSGGSAKAEGSGNSSSGNVTVRYSSCCMSEGCCINGTVGTVYNSDGSSSAAGYSYCMSYDVSVSCNAESASVKSAGCLNSSGEFEYSITVEGKTYSVSGYYSDGNGELTITGANGKWTCSYTDGAGECKGTGGDFTF